MDYTDENRGKIQYRKRAKQIIDFSGLKYRDNITPTDIDGCIEYKKKAYVFYEFKLANQEMPKGQRIALVEMVDDLQKAGKQTVLFLCSHNVTDPQKDIIAAETKVMKTYFNGEWKDKGGRRTAKEHTDAFIKWVDDRDKF